MFDWLYIIFIILAVLFLFLAIEYHDNQFWCGMFSVLDISVWFLLAATVFETETSYQLYNATSGNIESGIYITTSKVAPELMYFFYMMAIIMTIYLTAFVVFPAIYDLFYKDRRYENDRYKRRR